MPEKDIWSDLDLIDFSSLDEPRPQDRYPTYTPEEIAVAYNGDPLSSLRLQMANDDLRKAQAQAEGAVRHERKHHENNWTIAIDTPKGQVCLQYQRFGRNLFLGYPKGIYVNEETIMRFLGVERGYPVRAVNETSSSDERMNRYTDKDKPVKKIEEGFLNPVYIAYRDQGERQWAKFIGDHGINGGRVWIEQSEDSSQAAVFEFIDETGGRKKGFFGWDKSNTISTYEYNHHNQYAPDGPTTDPKDIKRYRDRFIDLASEIAFQMGGANSVTLDLGFVLVSEDLERERYTDITWLKKYAGPGRKDRGSIVEGKKGDSIVIVDSSRGGIPYTLVRIPTTRINSSLVLACAIKEDFLCF